MVVASQVEIVWHITVTFFWTFNFPFFRSKDMFAEWTGNLGTLGDAQITYGNGVCYVAFREEVVFAVDDAIIGNRGACLG